MSEQPDTNGTEIDPNRSIVVYYYLNSSHSQLSIAIVGQLSPILAENRFAG